VVDPLVNELSKVIKKRNKDEVAVKPFQINEPLSAFID